MRAIEFDAKIHDGLIVLPDEYQDLNEKQVRVILLIEDENELSPEQEKELNK